MSAPLIFKVMPLTFKERKKILQTTNTLDLTPVKLYSEKINNENLVTIIIPKFKTEFAKKFISPKLKSSDFKLNLEKFGSEIWMNMDGKKKVSEIIKLVTDKFGDEIQPAVDRVSKYIFQLYEQKLISFKEINR